MVGVVLRFSSVASCAYTRGVRVESPIRPFLTQQIASYGKVMGRTVGLFPLILVCLLGVSRLLLGDFDEGIFGSKGGFLGLVGVRSVIGLPTGIIYSLKLYTLNSCLGFYFYVNQGGFFWVSQGFGRLLVYPFRFFTIRTFNFLFPFGLLFLCKSGLEGWAFWSLRGSVGYWFTHWDYLLSKLSLLKFPFGLLFPC